MGKIFVEKNALPKNGEGKIIQSNQPVIASFNIKEKFYAMDGLCPHMGGPIGEGVLQGKVVTCPGMG